MTTEAQTPRENKNSRKRWPMMVVLSLVVLLVVWFAYLVATQARSSVTLPDGNTLTFVEVAEARGTAASADPWLPPIYEHGRGPFQSEWEPMWKRLPDTLRRFVPEPRQADFVSLAFDSASKQSVWFMVSDKFDHQQWRFFWVDEQGYESEAVASSAAPASAWLVVEGCMPTGGRKLHLRIRSRAGEQWRPNSPRDLGGLAADMWLNNPLYRREAVHSLTPQMLPVTVPCGDHTVTLSRVVRSRVVSQPTRGLRFEMHLDDGLPIASKFQLHDWIFENAAGTTMTANYLNSPDKNHFFSSALWSDAPVWKARVRACRYLEKDFAPDEKFVIQRLPVSPPPAGQATPQVYPWTESYTVKGHRLQVDSVEIGSDMVNFKITVTPPVGGRDLLMLNVADGQGRPLSPISPMFLGTSAYAIERNSKHTVFQVRYQMRNPRPTGLEEMNFTFGLQQAVPLEFTFRPEFEQ
ncbi:hypothetical protein [Roseimicrobium sp. ORNL1]|uniref:hypothetical protein n=1 Tax=Roseimicrobium sp. ORNL1 TaxID=2711231 RepID=UPI0013E1DFF1|nr:hypothetical protein [Roseimicrobium sp. ORNL1]QIF05694.1 hypothetical protein G5S37_30740 [Roseimicrobium sp. ORNL1]